MQKKIIALIGAGNADENTLKAAEKVGKLIAKRNAILICSGLGGVMDAATKGAKSEGGITVGILPQSHGEDTNPYIDVPAPLDLEREEMLS